MRQKPPLSDRLIASHIQQTYAITTQQVEFLPLGFDYGAAVYRLTSRENAAFFLKLRTGGIDPISLDLPAYLHGQGIDEVIPPLEDRQGRLSSRLEEYDCALYPFIAGQDGFEIPLTPAQWASFGAALRRIHSTKLPGALRSRLPEESWSPEWRQQVLSFINLVDQTVWTDPTAARTAELVKEHRETIRGIVDRAAHLADALERTSLERVLCHSDLHAGNLLIARGGEVYIVDWDSPILAPRERDLMFIGAGIAGIWNTSREQDLFYQGYGAVDLERSALAYYRWERIIQDIAEFCRQILLDSSTGEDRAQALVYFASQFEPGAEIDIAWQADPDG
jgi:spectinomycin phosphotransferase